MSNDHRKQQTKKISNNEIELLEKGLEAGTNDFFSSYEPETVSCLSVVGTAGEFERSDSQPEMYRSIHLPVVLSHRLEANASITA